MRKPPFLLRDYRSDDIPRILYVIKTAFAEQRGKVKPPSSAERKTIEIIEKELERANALVVEIEEVVVGCVCYQPKEDSAYIDRLAVLPEHRGRGIGTSLMKEAEKRAAEMGFRKFSISVRIELKNQQEYYRKMGYEIRSLKSHEGFEKPTYVKMEKHVSDHIL